MSRHVETSGPDAAEGGNAGALPQELFDVGQSLLDRGEVLLDSLWRPWTLYQLGIAALLMVLAHLLRAYVSPRMRAWLRSREGWPLWRMRYAVVVNKRLRAIFFVILMWICVYVMREMTWPSRSYLLAVIANLATAWLVIVLTTRLIGNAFLRGLVRYGAWIWVTLRILDLWDEAQSLLDSLAIEAGDFRLSLWMVLQAVMILGVLIFAARLLTRTTSSRVENIEDISPSMQVLVIKALQVVFYGAAIWIGLKAVGVDLTGLAFLSGAIGVGLGFGLQKVVSNLVSGVIILLDKSIKPGDVISLGETFGWINSLGARYVSVVTRDGKEYLIPNEDLITNQVVNWSHSNAFVRLDIHFGTSYADNPHDVRRIAIAAAQSVDRVLTIRPTVCHVVGFGDSSVDYVLRFWIEDPTGGLTNIRGNVYLALWDAFQANGISIPFPQREVKVLNPVSEPLA